MSKLSPEICAPGSMKPTYGPMHTDGSKKGGHARGGALANAGRTVGKGNPQGRLPVQSPPANVTGQKIGQSLPNVANASSQKPNRKGGSRFYGED